MHIFTRLTSFVVYTCTSISHNVFRTIKEITLRQKEGRKLAIEYLIFKIWNAYHKKCIKSYILHYSYLDKYFNSDTKVQI